MTFISERIKDLRENKKLSSKDLCSILGFDPSTYSNLESNKKAIDVEELKKISEFYDVSEDYILGINEPKTDLIEYIKNNKSLDDNAIKEVEMILSMMDEAIVFNDMRSKI